MLSRSFSCSYFDFARARARRLGRGALVAVIATLFFGCADESVNVLVTRDAAPSDTSADLDASVRADAFDDPSDDMGDGRSITDVSDGAARADIFDGSADARPDSDARPGSDASTGDTSSDASPDAPIVGCLPIGGSCSFAGQCCLLACPATDATRVCASDPVCRPAGEVCTSNADCCANRCEGAVCLGVPVGSCRPAGELCSADDDCCGASCALSGGVSRCALISGCRALGEICVVNDACCSQRCDAGVCVPP